MRIIWTIDDKIESACFDTVDPRDYQAEEILWAIYDFNPEWHTLKMRLSKHQNQLDYEPNGDHYCVPTSSSMCADVVGAELELDKVDFMDGWQLWVYMEQIGTMSSDGAFIRDGAKALKKVWMIGDYIQVNNIDEIKQMICDWYPILVWTNQLKLTQTHNTWYSVPWAWSGHCFWIVWYNDEWFIIPDPWKARTWILKYEHFKYLFPSKFAITKDEIFIKAQDFIGTFTKDEAKGLSLYNMYKSKRERNEVDDTTWRAFQIAYRKVYNVSIQDLL